MVFICCHLWVARQLAVISRSRSNLLSSRGRAPICCHLEVAQRPRDPMGVDGVSCGSFLRALRGAGWGHLRRDVFARRRPRGTSRNLPRVGLQRGFVRSSVNAAWRRPRQTAEGTALPLAGFACFAGGWWREWVFSGFEAVASLLVSNASLAVCWCISVGASLLVSLAVIWRSRTHLLSS